MWWFVALAFGQAEPVGVPDMNVQLFRPSLDARATVWADDARSGLDGLTPRVLVHYANRPLSFQYEGGGSTPVVDGVATADLMLGYGDGRVRAGVDVPIVLSAEGVAAAGEFGLGDVAADVRVTVVQPATADAVAVAVNARYAAPTATTANPLGSPRGDWEAAGILDMPFGSLPLGLVANLGLGGHPGVELEGVSNTQARLRAGLMADLSEVSGVALEYGGREPLSSSDSRNDFGQREVMLSAYASGPGVTLRGALGTGLPDRGVGTADMRALIGVQWTKQPPPPDTDGDGLPDPDDLCRTRPEDMDGVLDDDGCPDAPANVRIELVDAYGEPVTGGVAVYAGDTVVDQRQGGEVWALEPGEYRVVGEDADGDQVTRSLVVAPTDTERELRLPTAALGAVRINVVDTNGNPIEQARFFMRREKVGEGSTYSAQLEEGKVGMMVRAKGYRPARVVVDVIEGGVATKMLRLKPSIVQIDGGRFDLGDSVYFETGSATLAPRSYPLLDDVAGVLLDNPGLLTVRIEGHTDTQGRAADNLSLSQARAEAVRDYLVEAGVASERLEPVGFGEEQPVDRGNDEEAHERNRRVDFVITRQAR